MRRFSLLLLPAAAAALIAAGCGGDEANGDGGATGSDAAMEATEGAAMRKGSESAMEAEAMDAEAIKQDSEGAMKSDAIEPEAGAAMAAKGTRVKAVGSEYGRVIADGKGEALYLFDRERSPKPRCYGACAAVWPPLLAKGRPVAGRGAKQSLLGTTRRADGRLQVTYDGHPLYYYVHDSPGTILCHDVAEFGGLWLVVRPDGEAAV